MNCKFLWYTINKYWCILKYIMTVYRQLTDNKIGFIFKKILTVIIYNPLLEFLKIRKKE